MGNTHQTGVKKDDHGGSRNQQPQAASVVQVVSVVLDQDQSPAGAAERAPNQLHPLGGDGGGHDFQATSMLKNCKKTSATDGGGGRSRTESPPSLPELEGVKFVLNTWVNPRCVGDGDGFIVYVEKDAVVAVNGYKMAGDTNNRDPQKYRIRIRGIDAPELKMEYGVESKDELVKLIGGKRVRILVYGNDPYERYLGDVYCDDVFIEEQMLKRGCAWHYKTYDQRPELAQWEREARAAGLGLWSSDNPQKPWEWRRDNRRNNKKDNVDDSQRSTVRRYRRSPPGRGMGRKSAEERGRGRGWPEEACAGGAPADARAGGKQGGRGRPAEARAGKARVAGGGARGRLAKARGRAPASRRLRVRRQPAEERGRGRGWPEEAYTRGAPADAHTGGRRGRGWPEKACARGAPADVGARGRRGGRTRPAEARVGRARAAGGGGRGQQAEVRAGVWQKHVGGAPASRRRRVRRQSAED